jgi:uncharacterized protein (DUF58 family)
VSIRLTALGLLMLSVLLVGGFFSPVVADPEVTGIAWTALATIVAVGFLWPIVALLVVRVRVSSCPSDAMVGRPFDLGLELRGIGGGIDLRMVGRGQPWRSADVPDRVLLPVTPTTRGRLGALQAEIQLSGPLGIVRARRRVILALPRTLWIAPAPTAERWTLDPAGAGDGNVVSARASLVGDAVRSTRPYRPGDPAHLVHWPSTARSGSLVVRELEPPAGIAVAVVVALNGSVDQDDQTVSRASGLIRAIHSSGGRVALCTFDDGAAHTSVVTSLLEADRLLAAASAGPPGAVPDGWSAVWVGS